MEHQINFNSTTTNNLKEPQNNSAGTTRWTQAKVALTSQERKEKSNYHILSCEIISISTGAFKLAQVSIGSRVSLLTWRLWIMRRGKIYDGNPHLKIILGDRVKSLSDLLTSVLPPRRKGLDNFVKHRCKSIEHADMSMVRSAKRTVDCFRKRSKYLD